MKNEQFAKIFSKQVDICEEVLIKKAEEYGTEDRLHNFKIAATLQDCSPIQAVAGMMVKQTVSIYDMCQAIEGYHTMDQWDEKITDHINYLILLRATVQDSIWGENAKDQFPIEKPITLHNATNSS